MSIRDRLITAGRDACSTAPRSRRRSPCDAPKRSKPCREPRGWEEAGPGGQSLSSERPPAFVDVVGDGVDRRQLTLEVEQQETRKRQPLSGLTDGPRVEKAPGRRSQGDSLMRKLGRPVRTIEGPGQVRVPKDQSRRAWPLALELIELKQCLLGP